MDEDEGDIMAGCVGSGRLERPVPALALAALATVAIPGLDRPVGTPVRALVRARDVMLSLARPVGISRASAVSRVRPDIVRVRSSTGTKRCTARAKGL